MKCENETICFLKDTMIFLIHLKNIVCYKIIFVKDYNNKDNV